MAMLCEVPDKHFHARLVLESHAACPNAFDGFVDEDTGRAMQEFCESRGAEGRRRDHDAVYPVVKQRVNCLGHALGSDPRRPGPSPGDADN